MRYQWTDKYGDIGSVYTENGEIRLRLSEDPNEDEDDDSDPITVQHRLTPSKVRALHAALGRALKEVDPQPVTGSINSTLAACSAPVPPIVRVQPTGADGETSIDLTTGDGLTRLAVQGPRRVVRFDSQATGSMSISSVSVEELARLGLKPKSQVPSDHYLLECGHFSRSKQLCVTCSGDIMSISQRSSQPEPAPTGNGDLVTPPLLKALADQLDLAALVSARNAFGEAKYGTGLRTNNGRDPIEDARQELGDLLQYLQQATMEGKDIGPLLKLCRNGLAVFEKPTPTLHPRPFFWDDVGLFGFVNHGRLPPAERHGLDWLLAAVPNALEAKEADGSVLGVIPGFGFRPHHTGPRTLREYLTSPTPDESPLNQK